MTGWFRHHGFALADAFRHLLKTPGNFLLNVLVVSIALTLPFAGLTLIENVRPVSEQLAVEPEISVFMEVDATRERATAIGPEIRRIAQESKHAVKLEFIPREKALSTIKSKTGLDEAITVLGNNPLPDAYVVKMTGFQEDGDPKIVTQIADKLKELDGVEYVQIDSAWVERLAALMQVMRLILAFLAITLGVVVVAVVFNTIRLQVMTQREEIEVSRLVGATDAFICRPFYYTGALLGLIAGGVALITVAIGLQPLNTAIADFARLYASEFRLANLDPLSMLTLLGISAALGFLGAVLSVSRQLRRLQD
ncbi:MAG: permease-like cell division protein FtsX [Oxalicibacterium faecigallinarum]|uniref:permease-like cell division protein FtsX n=1 Tax=Oxalicibacterium faecigallinarum TaxID=573741 RepID=UPI0028067401|nr:permease-like cell division protein FtsX [Oxalicibacterium faecigallinarum]MDQ7970099.1 permease-like cell division protein FtsX [Oxalicibacterium faecigallinarum]